MADAAQKLARLQALRVRSEPDRSIGALIAAVAGRAKRDQKRLGSFVDLWEGVMPPELAARSRVVTVRGGVVHVSVDSSSAAYEVDRRLREGAEQQLRRAYGKTLLRVKVTVGDNMLQ